MNKDEYDIEDDNFSKTIRSMKNMYDNSSFNQKIKKIYIEPQDFNDLSKYEKNSLKSIANIFGIDKDKEISYDTLKQIIDNLAKYKTDVEKGYLLALFFPEKVKNIHQINPFPIPTYTYIQKFSVQIKPNTKGCFLIQAVSPILLDRSQQTNNRSNLWINTSENLDGLTFGASSDFTPVYNTLAPVGAFNTYVLQACKIGVKYHGRGDVLSGYFGASYHLTAGSGFTADPNTTVFNFVDDSPNSVIADVTEGVSAIYYPADYSYMNFLRVNSDNTGEKLMSTSHRLNIYGMGLPPEVLTGKAAGVTLTYCAIYNVIPTPQFSELLPLDYNVEDSSLDLLDLSKFVPQSGLVVHKNNDSEAIERLFSLPSHIRKQAMEQVRIYNNNNDKKVSLADVLKDAINPRVPYQFTFSKEFWTDAGFVNQTRKNAVDQLNNFNVNDRYS